MADSLPAPPPGYVCTAEEYALSLVDPTLTCLSRGATIGLLVIVEVGLVSLLAVVAVLVFIAIGALRQRRVSPNNWSVIQHPADLYILALFIADGVQATGAILDLKWVHDGRVKVGAYCTAQGVVQQLGEASVAIYTLVIAVHTFVGVLWRRGLHSLALARAVTAAVALFVALSVLIPNLLHRSASAPYEAPRPYWCFVSSAYAASRVWGEYIWFWATLLTSVLAYGALFLWARGTHAARAPARTLLAYPAVYCALVLPASAARAADVRRPGVPLALTALYGLSGAADVLLFVATRPRAALFGQPAPAPVLGCAPGPEPGAVGGEGLGEGMGSSAHGPAEALRPTWMAMHDRGRNPSAP